MLSLIVALNLCDAARKGNYKEVVKAIEEGKGDFDTKCDGETPLIEVAASKSDSNHIKIVRYLVGKYIKAGKAVEWYEELKDGKHLLHYAAFGGDMNQVKYLVEEKRADVGEKDDDGVTPLHYAAWGGHLDIVKYFVEEKGVDANVRSKRGVVPLHYAALGGSLDVVKYFVEEKGVDVNVKTDWGLVPLHAAAWGGSLDVVKYLVEEKGVDVNVKDEDGDTPLHDAAWGGSLDVVKYLVEEKGVDVNVKDKDGWTPLHWAAWGGHLDVAKYLVEEKGVDVYVRDKDGDTPLHKAAYKGHLDVVKYLVEERGVDINVKDKDGDTPLHKATYGGSLDVVKYLVGEYIKRGKWNVKFDDGKTLLHFAAYGGDLKRVRYLVQKGFDVNAKDKDGKIPLHYAAYGGHLDVVKYFVEEKGVDPNVRDKDDLTPLYYAAWENHPDVVKYLFDKRKPYKSRQIISSVDGLGAAVDSLKANDAAVIEYHDKRVYDYKIGSLSDGKDVYVEVTANGIGPGGYSLIFEAYLLDRNNPSDTIYLGGVGLRRWGMPHTLRNSPIERRYAYLWEDVQSFIKALRVYEFKDRYVAFFAAQEYLDEIGKYKPKFRIFVIPKAKKGEEGWFEPYYISWDVQGVKEALADVYFVGTLSEKEKKFNYMLIAEMGKKKKRYFQAGRVNEVKGRISYAVGTINTGDWKPGKDIDFVSLSR